MRYLLSLLLFLAPTYLIRFELFGLNTNLLMLALFTVMTVFIFWVVKNKLVVDFIRSLQVIGRRLLIFLLLFLIFGLISLLHQGFTIPKLGQFIVLFLEPIGIFFVIRYLKQRSELDIEAFIRHTSMLLAGLGLFSLIQYYFLVFLDPLYWGNSVSARRSTALWVHPNEFALFLLPLLAFLLPRVFQEWRESGKYRFHFIVCYILGSIGLFYSQSRSALLIFVLILALFFASKLKKRQLVKLFLLGLLIFWAIWQTDFKWRLRAPFYGDRAVSERAILGNMGLSMIRDNQLLGLGLTGFGSNFYKYYPTEGEVSTHYNSPHNWFLNFWVDTGIGGMISITAITFLGIWITYKRRKNLIQYSIALFLIALFLQGQLDTAYLRNDLALLYWMFIALT